MDYFTIQPVKSFLSKESVGLHTTLPHHHQGVFAQLQN